MVDLFFYRDPEEAEKEEQAAKEALPAPKEPYHEDGAEDPSYPEDLAAAPALVAPVAVSAPVAAEDWNEDETVGQSDWGGANTGF